jgi:hypothetical protein
VDGQPAKMSRDYILYLKGLCLGSSSHCFSFWVLHCSLFVSLFSLVLFCGYPLFTGGCILVTRNMHVFICPGLCWYNECATHLSVFTQKMTTIARVVKCTFLCISPWLGLVEGVTQQSLCGCSGLIAAYLLFLLLG